METTATSLVQVNDLAVHFAVPRGIVRAVDGVSFSIDPGETLGLVGESGCGKSTVARAIAGLLPITRGSVFLEDVRLDQLSPAAFRPHRRRLQMVFQDPYASLNPRMTVASIIAEPLVIHERLVAVDEPVCALMELVGLDPSMRRRYPHEFSGGQRQRIGLARALALDPALLLLDEPVSALDVSVQAQVLNLLDDLKRRLGLTYLFIAHNLAVVRYMSERVAVMYLGRIVELAPREALYENPLHPYSQALLSAVPVPDPIVERRRQRIRLEGELPSATQVGTGCAFRGRCAHAMERCALEAPALLEHAPGRFSACHLGAEGPPPPAKGQQGAAQ